MIYPGMKYIGQITQCIFYNSNLTRQIYPSYSTLQIYLGKKVLIIYPGIKTAKLVLSRFLCFYRVKFCLNKFIHIKYLTNNNSALVALYFSQAFLQIKCNIQPIKPVHAYKQGENSVPVNDNLCKIN